MVVGVEKAKAVITSEILAGAVDLEVQNVTVLAAAVTEAVADFVAREVVPVAVKEAVSFPPADSVGL